MFLVKWNLFWRIDRIPLGERNLPHRARSGTCDPSPRGSSNVLHFIVIAPLTAPFQLPTGKNGSVEVRKPIITQLFDFLDETGNMFPLPFKRRGKNIGDVRKSIRSCVKAILYFKHVFDSQRRSIFFLLEAAERGKEETLTQVCGGV